MESKPETPEDAQKDGRDKGRLEMTDSVSPCVSAGRLAA